MEYNDIITAITTVGFPIVAYGGLFWALIKQTGQHKEEMNNMTDAINNNTVALTKLIERLGGDK